MKNYTAVIEQVKQTKRPVMLTRRNAPQAVLVCLEDYARLEELRKPSGDATTER